MELKNAMFCWKVLGWIAMLFVVLCIVAGVITVFRHRGDLYWLLWSVVAAFGVAVVLGLVPWTVYAVLDQLRQQTAALQALTRPLSTETMTGRVDPQPIRIGNVSL